MYRHVLLASFLLLSWCQAQAAPADDIVFIAPTNHTLPLADFDAGGVLRGGILRDLGDAIAARLGRAARFVPMPSKRVVAALETGRADGVCYVLPQWIAGQFRWSRPLIPNAGVVAAAADAPELSGLEALADIPLGTVIGYRYPDFERALGERFTRADAPSMLANLHKLAAGRTRYAVVERATLEYFQRSHPTPPLKVAFEFSRFDARCAFSPRSRVPFEQIDAAIDALIEDGSIDRLLARYR